MLAVMDRENIALTSAEETMLATLYGHALDSRSRNSVLDDTIAADAVQRIDYDFRKTRVKGTSAVAIAIRAKVLDTWTARFSPTTRRRRCCIWVVAWTPEFNA